MKKQLEEKLKETEEVIDDLKNQEDMVEPTVVQKIINVILIVFRIFLNIIRMIYRFFLRSYRKTYRAIKNARKYVNLHSVRIGLHLFFKKKFCDDKFFENILQDIEKIPESNGCKYYEPYKIPIAIVADEFLFNSYNNIADFRFMTPDNYKEICDDVKYLLVVSAWRGLNNEWRGMSTVGKENNKIIFEAIEYYKKHNKTVVFYSKEDPPNYHVFLPIAQKCDIIFTSAEEKIKDYKKDCANENVYVMKFGINPIYHNPIGSQYKKRTNEVIFSGSWMKKYPNRIKEQGMIFDGVLQAGCKLKLIDRNYHLDNWSYFFPLKYYKYISPSIQHEYLQKVHKLYDWAINMNSVQESKTMFANRVYELQATGNLLISNESVGVREQFPDMKIVHTSKEVKEYLLQYKGKDEELYRRQMEGVRCVMTKETTFDRVGELLNICGEIVEQPKRNIFVVVEKITENIQDMFNEQSYENKKLVTFEEADKSISECDMFTIWDEESVYEEHYLEDMINGFKYTACDYITKNSYYREDKLTEGKEHDYTERITNLFATVFWNVEGAYQNAIQKLGDKQESYIWANGYNSDRFNYRR